MGSGGTRQINKPRDWIAITVSVVSLVLSSFSLRNSGAANFFSRKANELSEKVYGESLPRLRPFIGVTGSRVKPERRGNEIKFIYNFNLKNFGQTAANKIEFDLYGVEIFDKKVFPIFVDERMRNTIYPDTELPYSFFSTTAHEKLLELGAAPLQNPITGEVLGYDLPTEKVKMALVFLLRYCDLATGRYYGDEIYYSYIAGDEKLSSLTTKDQQAIDDLVLPLVANRQKQLTCK
ncbi:MAG: hypothetical protein G01um101431_250 [Parcubacteria group bacterium Gr01-1014_31]|nr:MAG: hypothetical protein G01um101431_250 [Parcubacteria group bacterium Gr01-1014_31]